MSRPITKRQKKQIAIVSISIILVGVVFGFSSNIVNGFNSIKDQTLVIQQGKITLTKPDVTTLEHQVNDLINQQRIDNGLKPLVFDSKLVAIAESHSQDMITRNYFAHNTPDGQTSIDRIKTSNSQYCNSENNIAMGENIFEGSLYGSDDFAKYTVNSWMNSPSHKENILERNYVSEGIGIAINGNTALVTEDFC